MSEIKEPMTQAQYDTLELQIKKEQTELKKEFSIPFNQQIREWLEMSFMLPKDKKENFITREKLITTLYQILRTQKKKFQDPKNIFAEIRYYAVFDKETNEIGKLFNIDFVNQTADYFTYFDKQNGFDMRTKHFRDILLFDYNSPQLAAMHAHYIGSNKNGLSFHETVQFLEDFNYNKKEEPMIPKGYGVELVKAEEHPMMKKVMIEYKIPDEIVKKPKRKLQKLDPDTLEVLEEFDSVKDAEEKTGIRAAAISNVLCGGFSARNYLVTKNFKWQYSNECNKKYYLCHLLGKDYNTTDKKKWDDMTLEIMDADIVKWINTLKP